MSKIPCEVIRDLMVLYEDDACSEESRQIVDAHIEECEECRGIYQMAERPLPEISVGRKEEGDDSGGNELWEITRRAFKKFERKLTYKSVIIFSVVILAVMFADVIWVNTLQYRVRAIPAEDIGISELYELENGDIYCTFTSKDLFAGTNISELKVPEGEKFQDSNEGWYEVSFQYPKFYERFLDDRIYDDQISIVFSKKEQDVRNWIEDEAGNLVPDESAIASTHLCSAIYYNGKGKKDSLTVWEEGQQIKPAPEAVEKKVRREIEARNYYEEYSVRIIP